MKNKVSLLFGKVSRLLFIPVCAAGVLLGGIAAYNYTPESSGKELTMSYTLREYEGKIGVFRDGNTVPDEILDVYLITLPEEDVKKLRNGIEANGQDEVRSLIEDFTG